MAIGDNNDMLGRLKSLIPYRWFAFVAPLRDAVLGGLADQLAWIYSFIGYATAQTRLATMSGIWLDLFAYDFFGLKLKRRGSVDDIFRARISAELLRERVTRAGMVRAITDLTGKAPVIFEPWNTGDTGGWDSVGMAYAGSNPGGGGGGGYDRFSGYDLNRSSYDPQATYSAIVSGGAGAWGDTNLPAQFFITAYRPGLQGIPYINGFDNQAGGYDAGVIEWTDRSMISGSVTDQDIYDAINATRPTGTIAWTRLH
jgi:hypothetical protein